MPARNAIAIDIGRRRLRALLARRDGGILRITRTLAEDLPADLDYDDAPAVGAWLAGRLKDEGFPRRARATLALPREHVGLKRITLPTIDDHELPDMTRLAMQRELPFDAESAVIDFLPVARAETSITVLAVAVPQAILDQALAIARAARLGVERVSLRSMGSALLLRHLGQADARPRGAGSILAVDITGEAVEFCVIDHGAVRFSRAADLQPMLSHDDLAEAVLTETRRTWMSYRIAEDSSEVRHVLIMGDRRVSERVAGPVGQMLGVDAEVLRAHGLVDAARRDMQRHWPLAGLLLESARGGETIDFANPRRAPDLAAEKRKRLLFAAGVAVVALLGAWTFANRHLATLEQRSETVRTENRAMLPDYVRHHRDRYKLEHIQQWKSADVHWLEHLSHITETACGPLRLASATPQNRQSDFQSACGDGALVLDSWQGVVGFRGVQFDRRSREWDAPREVTITVNGEARDRSTADAFREALVRAPIYRTTSTGADAEGGRRLPYGFTYRLQTDATAPVEEPPRMEAAR